MGQNQAKGGDAESPERDPFLDGGVGGGEAQSDPNTNHYPLHLAASSGKLGKVKELLNGSDNSKYSVYDEDKKGRTPLHCATLPDSSHHNLKVVEFLLQRDKEEEEDPSSEGKPPLANLQDASKKTALHYAAESNRPQVVSLLLQFGADPNLKDENERTPLHCATLAQSPHNLEVIQLLLERDKEGPSFSGRKPLLENLQDASKHPALHYAAVSSSSSHPNLKAFEFLLQRVKENPSSSSRRKPVLVNLPDASWRTAMHYAAASRNPEMVSLLLRFGADPNLKDARGFTPLHILAESNSDSALKCAQLILSSPSFSISAADSETSNNTVCKLAASNSAPKLLKLLKEHGLDIARPDTRGLTPLMVAASWNSGSEDKLECATDPPRGLFWRTSQRQG